MSLRNSASHEVQVLSRFLARDVQSVTGRNLRLIQDLNSMNLWSTSYGQLRHALISAEMVPVPLLDIWRLPYLCSLLAQRREAQNLASENEEKRLNELIDSLVMN